MTPSSVTNVDSMSLRVMAQLPSWVGVGSAPILTITTKCRRRDRQRDRETWPTSDLTPAILRSNGSPRPTWTNGARARRSTRPNITTERRPTSRCDGARTARRWPAHSAFEPVAPARLDQLVGGIIEQRVRADTGRPPRRRSRDYGRSYGAVILDRRADRRAPSMEHLVADRPTAAARRRVAGMKLAEVDPSGVPTITNAAGRHVVR